jgi:predicted ATPase/signal transduction histidine kinase/predicted Ser/Thr protein kinase
LNFDLKEGSQSRVPNYEITSKLGDGPLSTVFLGYDKAAPDHRLVIKLLKAKAASQSRRNYFRQKIEHLKILNDQRLVPPIAFEEFRGTQVIVRDFYEGKPLNEWVKERKKLGLELFLELAAKLADALDIAHRAGIIHGGIKPHNILVHPRTLDLRLVDFITPLDVRNISHFIYDRDFVEGTLPYTSPEQTGRISYRVDFTTDLYSLGIIFYELLAGKLPFFSLDPLELIHSHLAEEAQPPHELNPEIPLMVSRIVSKLILKQPEKRYQSASGLYADLMRCLLDYREHKSVKDFVLGMRDRSHRVTFVSKMVGRDSEARTILSEFDAAAKGSFRSLFISGFSGIGKTRLIQELQKPIVKNRGYFTSGKFDVYQKNIPYSSLIQAFRNLMRTFLTESDERVEDWRRKILAAVGNRGRVVTEVIPELETLIGEQPEFQPLPPIEARNRFHDVFGRFLGCLASEESPIVLFIDDLQWCDIASFDFIAEIFADHKEHPYLFFLGAYRHNEVDESHPLTKLIASIPQSPPILKEIRLKELGPEHTHEMVSYILDSPPEATGSLARFIFDLTEGNPLFVSESLSYLYNEKLISFDEETLEWSWNLEKIRDSNMPSNVVTLFSSKVQRLPRNTIDLLEYCACMGNLFSPDHLARTLGISILETFETLQLALSHGLLMENKDQLQFVHDKIQEATLREISSDRRRRIHSEIGNLLLSLVPKGTNLEAVDSLFTIVSHLNLGRDQVLDEAAAYELSNINYHAGNKALDSLATEAANDYFRKSLELLPEGAWDKQYERTFSIYRKLAKTELMVGRYESSERLLNELVDRAKSDLDKAEALAEQTTSLSSFGNFIKAIETANRGLAYFEKSLPDDVALATKKREQLMAGISEKTSDPWGTILNMPFTTDRRNKVELAFYAELIPDLYMSGIVSQLYLSAAQSTQHCLAGGMDESVIYSFSIMGLCLGEQEKFEDAFRYEDLARNLSERHPNTFGSTRGINGVVWCNMHSRSRPSEIIRYSQKGIQSGKNCGDLYNAGLCYGPLMWNQQVEGTNMAEIEATARECLQFSQKFHLSFSVGLAEAVQAGWIAPMKKGYQPVDMTEKIRKWESVNHIASIGSYYVHLALTHYYFREYDSAEEALQKVNTYLHGLTDNVLKRQWFIFRALNAIALHEQGKAYKSREALLAFVDPILAKVEKWAALGPLLRPYLALLKARLADALEGPARAREMYFAAVESARKEGYTFLEGHIQECLADLLIRSDGLTADVYQREALRLYRLCGAERAEYALLDKAPALAAEAQVSLIDHGHPESESGNLPSGLDVHYLMKSALAISAETNAEVLLGKIMNVVLESSGAQHGYLLLFEDGELFVRVERHVGEREGVANVKRSLNDSQDLSKAIVRYVYRTREPVILHNALEHGRFKNDAEVQALKMRSVFCLPLVEQNRLLGVLYLENRLSNAVFNETRTEMTYLLASQAVISLENARLLAREQHAKNLAQEADRAKDLFLANLSHELRTPLTPILAWAHMLRSGRLAPEKGRQAVEMIERSAITMRELIDDLLDISRIVMGKLSLDFQEVDMAKAAEAALEQVRPEGDARQLKLDLQLQPNLPHVSGDFVRLQQVIWNLLGNSVKFTPKDGQIFLKVNSGTFPKSQRHAIVVEVSDNGRGIEPAFLPHVFERFSQADRSSTRGYRGLGLGLSIVRSLVEMHGGEVQAESAGLGKGSTFRFFLPIHEA